MWAPRHTPALMNSLTISLYSLFLSPLTAQKLTVYGNCCWQLINIEMHKIKWALKGLKENGNGNRNGNGYCNARKEVRGEDRMRITLSCVCAELLEKYSTFDAQLQLQLQLKLSHPHNYPAYLFISLSLCLSLSYSLAPHVCDFNLNGSHTHRYSQASRQCLSALTVHQNEWCMQNSYCPYESYKNTLHCRAFWQAESRYY